MAAEVRLGQTVIYLEDKREKNNYQAGVSVGGREVSGFYWRSFYGAGLGLLFM